MSLEELINSSRPLPLPQELDQIAFAHGFWPWMSVARSKLFERIEKPLTHLLPEALFSLEKVLVQRWSRVCMPSLALEMKIARMQGELVGKTSEERYLDFVRQLFSNKEKLRQFLREYRHLGSLLESFLVFWVESSAEFLERLEKDLAILAMTFNQGKTLGKVADLKFGLSDPHQRGKTVVEVKFESGCELFYKPKDLRISKAFYEICQSLNEQGLSPKLKGYQILPREGYGWEEKIHHLPCKTVDEVRRYYLRVGMLLCLLYLLNGIDIHYENIIAFGEDPLPIDLETILHPTLCNLKTEKFHLMKRSSVLGVGLLPCFDFIHKAKKVVDSSGLGRESEVSYKGAVWKGINTDRMELGIGEIVNSNPGHRVIYQGNETEAHHYTEEIVAGFKSVYELIQRNRSLFLAENGWLNRLSEYPTRCVVRPTRFYRYLLDQFCEPKLLLHEDEMARRLASLNEFAFEGKRESLAPLSNEEKKVLLQGDIPFFHIAPKKRDLFANGKIVVKNFVDRTVYDDISKRIEEMDQRDLELQEIYIRQSFFAKTAVLHGPQPITAVSPSIASQNCIDRETILKHASMIAHDLLKQASRGKEGNLVWVNLSPFHKTKQMAFGPVGYSLFSGNVGIALFFAAMSHVDKDNKWRDETFNTLHSLRYRIHKEKGKLLIDEMGIGGMFGVGGVIYGLCTIGKLLNTPELIEDATKLIRCVQEQHIDQDANLDIVLGSAGLLLGLLTLWNLTKETQLLKLAVYCGRHLCENGTSTPRGIAWETGEGIPLLGFSHGVTGIAYALHQLAQASNEPLFANVADQALAYERSHFSSTEKNWPILKLEGEPTYRSSWCHGAVGVGFGRLGSMDIQQDRFALRELKIALEKAEEDLLDPTHGFSLCCGSFGRFELLMETARKLPGMNMDKSVDVAFGKLFSLYQNYRQNKGGFSKSRALYDPSFMQGISGIGYTLLRRLDDQVPQVLLFS